MHLIKQIVLPVLWQLLSLNITCEAAVTTRLEGKMKARERWTGSSWLVWLCSL